MSLLKHAVYLFLMIITSQLLWLQAIGCVHNQLSIVTIFQFDIKNQLTLF